jgi:hypothetical protein
VGSLFASFGNDISDDDISAELRKTQRASPPDAAATARHYRHLIGEQNIVSASHAHPPFAISPRIRWALSPPRSMP